MKIDSHQHFWKFDPVRDSWIDDSMSAIRRDFYPEDLEPILKKHNIDGCIAVQADQSEAETEFLLNFAEQHDFIKGVVGWVNLMDPHVRERIAHYSENKKLKGIRHVLQGEPDRAYMLNPQFMKGIAALKNYDLAYDILVFPDQLGYTNQFVKNISGVRYVIDHIAKPDIKNKNIDKWANSMRTIAQHENVWCKVSGMVTEADWQNWQEGDFEPYLNVVFEAFGANRVMFGSDWPVCDVAGGYDKMIGIVEKYTAKLSVDEQARFWGLNAIEFYKLS
ncbi:amidohydrolase family protein [Mucilaginibacter sp. BJC16-A38]|uniref:amidohydrolase family protein n=1 Tax=Mucilaginibacter phenanthrenivorans TaxID=1234842 RepID=UPI002158A059|nr:amidohydrolase family protein [Mucilaginibacter phenanthrenivorans]MCR8556345.1 amidohydrolase family protein [Mucilaginibacter phenanthrenivorans]